MQNASIRLEVGNMDGDGACLSVSGEGGPVQMRWKRVNRMLFKTW